MPPAPSSGRIQERREVGRPFDIEDVAVMPGPGQRLDEPVAPLAGPSGAGEPAETEVAVAALDEMPGPEAAHGSVVRPDLGTPGDNGVSFKSTSGRLSSAQPCTRADVVCRLMTPCQVLLRSHRGSCSARASSSTKAAHGRWERPYCDTP